MPLVASILLSSIGSQINEIFAKSCANENIGKVVATYSCGPQGPGNLFLSSPINDVKTISTGNSATTHAISNSNSGGSSRGQNSESPFVLPFP
jgi:hypothetical protein